MCRPPNMRAAKRPCVTVCMTPQRGRHRAHTSRDALLSDEAVRSHLRITLSRVVWRHLWQAPSSPLAWQPDWASPGA